MLWRDVMQGGYWSSYLPPPPDMRRYQPGGVVLDVGCGRGSQLNALRQECRAIGLELSPQAAHACRTEGHRVTVGTAEKLPFRSQSCQGIPCKVVLPYTDERLAISEIARVLVKGGVAVSISMALGTRFDTC
jgi:ubiquinone/menaquinone biosynthesis C-methylase UbiE